LLRSLEQREQLLREFKRSGLPQSRFAALHGIPQATLSGWIVAERTQKQGPARRKAKEKPGPYSPDQRRQAVEAYLKSGISLDDFGRIWGIAGRTTLQKWVQLYRESGPRALEKGYLTRDAKRRGPKGIAQGLRDEIVRTKLSHPEFGLRKIRDFLARFNGVNVSTGSVRKTLREAKLPNAPKPKRKPKRHPVVHRFERARPMQLWQSDITMLNLTRQGTRLYLTVFLDDYSRYIVGWGISLRQTSQFVMEALLEGVQRFGKPEEVLTDQGRQYFT
jgi:transposase-like protein